MHKVRSTQDRKRQYKYQHSSRIQAGGYKQEQGQDRAGTMTGVRGGKEFISSPYVTSHHVHTNHTHIYSLVSSIVVHHT